MSSNVPTIHGRTWVFPDSNINTDLMMPPRGYGLPLPERAKLIFSANRPGWSDAVLAGDVLIGGKNFGTGSSRPAAQILLVLGIRALVAESINGLFFRNCVNYGLPAIECPGVVNAVAEGDMVTVGPSDGIVTNQRTGQTLTGTGLPDTLMDIIAAGGLYQQLQNEGYI